ncbi:hypothetical protein JTE90_003393 [Oedothorax gibbosus]|uniref:Uncharacterized protein n=1 Tax=Oedothorax gibbosus TaxID=931172 RepID=A0AAV6TZ45_9ARAC|nr:hypothetical protein JTE90_003393 [Oedothorax gibbosus]
MPNPIDYTEISNAQIDDIELKQLIENSEVLQFQKINLLDGKEPVYCDVSTGTARPYIPQPFRKAVFASLHGLSHPGIRGAGLCDRNWVYTTIVGAESQETSNVMYFLGSWESSYRFCPIGIWTNSFVRYNMTKDFDFFYSK